MEGMEAIMTAVNTMGFPIVCCGALFWKINKQDSQHKEEMTQLSEVINKNTDAIKELALHLKGGNKND